MRWPPLTFTVGMSNLSTTSAMARSSLAEVRPPHMRGTEILGKVAREEEALELIVAIMQLYREEGWYLERIYKWMVRAGLESIRARTLEDSGQRRALYDRFVHSQSFAQVDPWAERAAGAEAREFEPLAVIPMGMAAE